MLTHRCMCSWRKTSLSVQVVSNWESLLQRPNSRSGQHLLWVQLGERYLFAVLLLHSPERHDYQGRGVWWLEWERKGFSIKLKISLVQSHHWIWTQTHPSVPPKLQQILCSWSAAAEMGHLWLLLWVLGSGWVLCQVSTEHLFCFGMLWLPPACHLEACLSLGAASWERLGDR